MSQSHNTHNRPAGDIVPTDPHEVAAPRFKRCGYVLRAAMTTLVLVTTGGLEYLVKELRLTWNRLRLLSRDEAGYTTMTRIVVALLVVIAMVGFVVLWMTVISKAIHTRVECHPGKPCG